MAANIKLAAGHDNSGSLQALHEFDSDLFQRYELGDISFEWHDEEEMAFDGGRAAHRIGLPWCALMFSGMSEAELQYLDENLFLYAPSAPVTIQVYDKRHGDYRIYNGTMVYPGDDDKTWRMSGWSDVRVIVTDLQEHSPFTKGFLSSAFGE